MEEPANEQQKANKVNSFVLKYNDTSVEVRVRTTSVAARKEISVLQLKYNDERKALNDKYREKITKHDGDTTTLGRLDSEVIASDYQVELNKLDDSFVTQYARALVDKSHLASKKSTLEELVETTYDDDFWQSQDIVTLRNMYFFFRDAA